ncbi:MAG: ABC transporter permease subunit [Spirochaetaceae bacterium]|jgi:ABC-2 type transport system permease protein|nr:ABC transporter permease subunit [Spirochaetaceae bacterium]
MKTQDSGAKEFLPRRALALAARELYSSSYAPAVYGIGVFFLVFTSVWFFYVQRFFVMGSASLRPYFSGFPLAFILVIPVITMKSWAEERKTGSVELLLTMPFSEWDLVLGKFLASLGVLCFFLVLTVPVPLSLFPLGRFQAGVIASEYIGALLLGSSALSLGLLLSSLSKNQAGAFLGSAVVLMTMMLVSQLNFTFNLPGFIGNFCNFISLPFHFESFSKGIIDSRDGSFFILSALLFLFLNTRVILFRKWS